MSKATTRSLKVTAIALAIVVALVSPPLGGASSVAGKGAAAGDTVDWRRGLVISRGAAAADLRAPSAEMARVGAERLAWERARAALALQVKRLPWANGATVGARVRSSSAARKRIVALVARARSLNTDYASDGSVVVTAAVPLEGVRDAVVGEAPPAAPAGSAGKAAPAAGVLVIDATGVLRRPRLGLTARLGSISYQGPTVFCDSIEHALADPRVDRENAVVVRATRLARGALRVQEKPEQEGAVARARDRGALVVVVVELEPSRRRGKKRNGSRSRKAKGR